MLRRDLGRAPMLVLVERKPVHGNDSWLHDSFRLVKDRVACTLLRNHEDAVCRGLNSGERVGPRSSAGSVVVPVDGGDELGCGT